MVNVAFSLDESKRLIQLDIKGHAGMEDAGKDIVCSACTILAYTIAQTVKSASENGECKGRPTIRMSKGNARIICRSKTDDLYAEMLHSFLVIQTGYILLAHNYPEYVALKKFGES